MKKIFLYALMLFSGFSCISCSDDDEKGMVYLANLHTSFLCNLIYPTFSRILLYSC